MSGTGSNAHPGGRTRGRATLLLGGGLVGAALIVALAGRLVVLAGALAARPGAAGPDDLVELGILAVGIVVLGWLVASCAITAGCLLARSAGRGWSRGEAWVHRFAPALVRRALVVSVVAGLGLAGASGATAGPLGAAGATPAAAVATTADPAPPADLGWVVTSSPAPTPTAAAPTADPAAVAVPTPAPSPAAGTAAASPASASAATAAAVGDDGDPDASTAPSAPTRPMAASADATPSPTAGTPATDSTPGAPPAATLAVPSAAAGTVVVSPGDTLWAIAARHLGDEPSDAAIAAAWPAWYQANAATIGADPDLIRPGQVLRAPAATGTGARP